MNIERLAYLVLKEVIKNERRDGEIVNILTKQGIDLSDISSREIGDFIQQNGLGKTNKLPRGGVLVRATSKADKYVADNEDLTFEEKIRLLYEELKVMPDRKGNLGNILSKLGISYSDADISDINHFIRSNDHAIVFDSKNQYDFEVMLQKPGLDYLRQPRQQEPPPQNITIENYHDSIVAKGDNISQSDLSVVSGKKNESNKQNTNPITNPPIIPNPKSPTRKIQTWQLIVAVLSGIAGIAMLILKIVEWSK